MPITVHFRSLIPKYVNVQSCHLLLDHIQLTLIHGLNGVSYVVLVAKNLLFNAGDVRYADSIPALGRSPGRGHGNSLQYSYLENPKDR